MVPSVTGKQGIRRIDKQCYCCFRYKKMGSVVTISKLNVVYVKIQVKR